MRTDSVSNQLRWVILLLAAAVILPTVCLLWFMNQAVKNERLAVRQKLMDICNEEIEKVQRQLIEAVKLPNKINNPDHLIEQPNILLWINTLKENANSILIYDKAGKLLYPIIKPEIESVYSTVLQKPLQLEQQGQFEQALEMYQQMSEPNQPADLLFQSCMGQIRCLDKLGRIIDAVDFIQMLFRSDHIPFRTHASPTEFAMLRVKRVELLARHQDNYFNGDMFSDLKAWYTKSELYPSLTTVWALEKILDITPEFMERYDLDDSIKSAQNIIQTEKMALSVADFLREHSEHREQTAHTWYGINSMPDVFMMFVSTKKYDLYYIKDRERLAASFGSIFEDFSVSDTKMVLYDNLDRVVYGPVGSKNTPFIVSDLSDFSPGWKIELFLENDNPFQKAAKRQQYVYFWTASLMIFLVLLAGGISIRIVDLQAKTNRLKNDFIATVTHELKTPLASMRLLVDTLLEGNYEGEQTATEYLQLVANENKRLTHLIDSFLTFSRMERNKQVFDFQPTQPEEIVTASVDATQAKFSSENCHFSCTVAENLPAVPADRDGIVTVLVNLLDNAYKYTNSEKKIELSVYEENGSVCFKVTDNGIGLNPRAQRKIFNRFYQVDSRLSRRAEGCGLGLSIVKFIVNAHKGSIEVTSSPGKGSVFTVKLPV